MPDDIQPKESIILDATELAQRYVRPEQQLPVRSKWLGCASMSALMGSFAGCGAGSVSLGTAALALSRLCPVDLSQKRCEATAPT